MSSLKPSSSSVVFEFGRSLSVVEFNYPTNQEAKAILNAAVERNFVNCFATVKLKLSVGFSPLIQGLFRGWSSCVGLDDRLCLFLPVR